MGTKSNTPEMTISDCIFCHPDPENIILQSRLCYVYKDRFPAVKGHCLIITERHVPDFFNLTKDEILDCMSVLKEQKQILSSKDPSIKGFNVGVNIGITSGQTIMHCHIHLIPRRDGDVDDPVGGVRNVIPGKGNYLSL